MYDLWTWEQRCARRLNIQNEKVKRDGWNKISKWKKNDEETKNARRFDRLHFLVSNLWHRLGKRASRRKTAHTRLESASNNFNMVWKMPPTDLDTDRRFYQPDESSLSAHTVATYCATWLVLLLCHYEVNMLRLNA